MHSETLTRWYKEGSHYFLSDDTELRAIRPWQRPDSWAGKPWNGWFVGLTRTRGSGILTESNFYVFLNALRALPEVTVDDTENVLQSYCTEREDWTEVNTVMIVPESHWACGWIEWVAIHPKNEAAIKLADEMLCAISSYCVLDEDDWSRREDEAVMKWWQGESVPWRIELCRDNNESIFAARHDYPPESVYNELRERV